MTRLPALCVALAAATLAACTPPPAQKTQPVTGHDEDEDEPVRSVTRFDVGAVPAAQPEPDGTCGPPTATRNPEVTLLDAEALAAALATPKGFSVTEPSDAAAATAPKGSPLVPTARRMYRKGAAAPLSVELRDAVRECELDQGEALAEAYTAEHEGLETKQTVLGPASVGKDTFRALVSGRCILTVEGPDAGRLAPRFVDAGVMAETCSIRTGAPIPR